MAQRGLTRVATQPFHCCPHPLSAWTTKVFSEDLKKENKMY